MSRGRKGGIAILPSPLDAQRQATCYSARKNGKGEGDSSPLKRFRMTVCFKALYSEPEAKNHQSVSKNNMGVRQLTHMAFCRPGARKGERQNAVSPRAETCSARGRGNSRLRRHAVACGFGRGFFLAAFELLARDETHHRQPNEDKRNQMHRGEHFAVDKYPDKQLDRGAEVLDHADHRVAQLGDAVAEHIERDEREEAAAWQQQPRPARKYARRPVARHFRPDDVRERERRHAQRFNRHGQVAFKARELFHAAVARERARHDDGHIRHDADGDDHVQHADGREGDGAVFELIELFLEEYAAREHHQKRHKIAADRRFGDVADLRGEYEYTPVDADQKAGKRRKPELPLIVQHGVHVVPFARGGNRHEACHH